VGGSPQLWETLYVDATSASEAHEYDSAKRLFRQAVNEAEGLPQPDIRLGLALNRLASLDLHDDTHSAARNYARAAAVFERLKKTKPSELVDKETADSLCGLAETAQAGKDAVGAVALYKKALALDRRCLAGQNNDGDPLVSQNLATCLLALARISRENGDVDASDRYYANVLEDKAIRKQQLADIAGEYSAVLAKEGKQNQAQAVTSLAEKGLSGNSPAAESFANNLAAGERALHEEHNLERAQSYLEAALKDVSQEGPKSVNRLKVLSELIFLRRHQHEKAAGERVIKQALDCIDHADLSDGDACREADNSLVGAARFYDYEDKLPERQAVLERLLKLRESYRGVDNKHVAETLADLADIERSRGAYGKAEPLLERAVAIWAKCRRGRDGAEEKELDEAVAKLGDCYLHEGKAQKAVELKAKYGELPRPAA
jgi:tetratricopeptide (TPR) repeat protein